MHFVHLVSVDERYRVHFVFDRQLPTEFNMFSSGGTTGVDDLSEMCVDAQNSHQAEIQTLNLMELSKVKAF